MKFLVLETKIEIFVGVTEPGLGEIKTAEEGRQHPSVSDEP